MQTIALRHRTTERKPIVDRAFEFMRCILDMDQLGHRISVASVAWKMGVSLHSAVKYRDECESRCWIVGGRKGDGKRMQVTESGMAMLRRVFADMREVG